MGAGRKLRDNSYSAVQRFKKNRKCGVERPEDVKEGISVYYKWSKRKGRKLVHYLGMGVMERKILMALQIYRYLVKDFFKIDNK